MWRPRRSALREASTFSAGTRMRSEREDLIFPVHEATPAADDPVLVRTERGRHFAASLAGLIAIVLLAATFKIGVDKDLDKTITPHEWGRYNFAIAAAI